MYEYEQDQITLKKDPNCCGYEGDCEGCNYFSWDFNYCNYKV